MSSFLKYAENLLESVDQKASESLSKKDTERASLNARPVYVSRRERVTDSIVVNDNSMEKADKDKVTVLTTVSLENEVKILNSELTELDTTLVNMQSDLDASENQNLDLLNQIREMKLALKDGATSFKVAKAEDEKKLRKALNLLTEKDISIKELERNVKRLESDLTSRESDYAAKILELNSAKQQDSNDSKNAETHINDKIQGLYSQIHDLQVKLEQNQNEKLLIQRQSRVREGALGRNVSELTEALVLAQKSIEEKSEEIDIRGATTHNFETDLHVVHQELRATESSLTIERQRNLILKKEVEKLARSVSHLKLDISSKDTEIRSLISIHKLEIDGLNEQLQHALNEAVLSKSKDETAEFQNRYTTLARKVLEKQEIIESLKADNKILQSKLTSAQSELSGFNESIGDGTSMNSNVSLNVLEGGGYSKYYDSGSTGNNMTRKRRNYKNISSQLTPILPVQGEKSKSVVHAVDAIDDLTMVAGNILRRNPLIRLLFLIYVLILHSWMFYMTMFHVHSLDTHSNNSFGTSAKNRFNRND